MGPTTVYAHGATASVRHGGRWTGDRIGMEWQPANYVPCPTPPRDVTSGWPWDRGRGRI